MSYFANYRRLRPPDEGALGRGAEGRGDAVGREAGRGAIEGPLP